MLPVFYQTHLKSQLGLSDYLMLKILISLLQSIKKVNLETLATVLPFPILFQSRRKKIQRFLSLPCLNIETIWLPIVKACLEEYFPTSQVIYIVIDRTTWGCINLFMISVVWEKRAFPIYFELLPKLGSSNLNEQKGILSKVLPLFKKYKVVILGDREFCSVKLADWLRASDVYFCLRLKKNEFVQVENDIWVAMKDLGLSPGISVFLKGLKVIKTQGYLNFNIAGKWRRNYLGWTCEEGWFILTNLGSFEGAIKAYKNDLALKKCLEILRVADITWKTLM